MKVNTAKEIKHKLVKELPDFGYLLLVEEYMFEELSEDKVEPTTTIESESQNVDEDKACL